MEINELEKKREEIDGLLPGKRQSLAAHSEAMARYKKMLDM